MSVERSTSSSLKEQPNFVEPTAERQEGDFIISQYGEKNDPTPFFIVKRKPEQAIKVFQSEIKGQYYRIEADNIEEINAFGIDSPETRNEPYRITLEGNTKNAASMDHVDLSIKGNVTERAEAFFGGQLYVKKDIQIGIAQQRGSIHVRGVVKDEKNSRRDDFSTIKFEGKK